MLLPDSNFWIALMIKNDVHHPKAVKTMDTLEKEIATTQFIIAEAATVLAYKVGKRAADSFVDFILNAREVHLLDLDKARFNDLSQFFISGKKKLSFVDYSIIYLNKHYGFDVLTFDKQLQKELQKIPKKKK